MPSAHRTPHRLGFMWPAKYPWPVLAMVLGLICLGGLKLAWSFQAGQADINPLWVLEPVSLPSVEPTQLPTRWAKLVPVDAPQQDFKTALTPASLPEVEMPFVPAVAPPVVQVVSSVVEKSEAPTPAPAVARNPASQPARTFNGRPIRKVKTIRMLVTGYSPDERSCGDSADNITASGYSVWTNGMKMVAADTRILPFGSIISVPGYDDGQPVPVMDRGGAIKGMRLDLLYPTHEIARQWGKKWVDVTVWQYVE